LMPTLKTDATSRARGGEGARAGDACARRAQFNVTTTPLLNVRCADDAGGAVASWCRHLEVRFRRFPRQYFGWCPEITGWGGKGAGASIRRDSSRAAIFKVAPADAVRCRPDVRECLKRPSQRACGHAHCPLVMLTRAWLCRGLLIVRVLNDSFPLPGDVRRRYRASRPVPVRP